jgi:exodeoxyribonuclease VII small subunit
MAKAASRPTTDDSPDVDEGSDPAVTEFPDIADLSYEAARDELTAIVAQLEGGQVPLEEGMRLWRRGEALAEHCTAWLDGAQRQISEA